jgi:hypothetical protein
VIEIAAASELPGQFSCFDGTQQLGTSGACDAKADAVSGFFKILGQPASILGATAVPKTGVSHNSFSVLLLTSVSSTKHFTASSSEVFTRIFPSRRPANPTSDGADEHPPYGRGSKTLPRHSAQLKLLSFVACRAVCRLSASLIDRGSYYRLAKNKLRDASNNFRDA